MIFLRRFIPLLLGACLLVFTAETRWGDAAGLWDPRAFALTLVLPWLALACSDSLSAVHSTFTEGFLLSPRDAPPERLRRVRSRLRYLAGATLAAGALAAVFAFVSELHQLASQKGQGEIGVWPKFAAGFLLGPLYGILFKVFFYDAAESALTAADADVSEVFE